MTNRITLTIGDRVIAHWDMDFTTMDVVAQELVSLIGPGTDLIQEEQPDAEALLARVRERLTTGNSYHLAEDLMRILDPDALGRGLGTMPISELDLSVRMLNALDRNGIKTVADLVYDWTFWEVAGIRNIGRTSMAELVVELRHIGATLNGTPDDFPGDAAEDGAA